MKRAFLLSLFLSTLLFARSADQVMVMPHTGNVPGWGQVDLSQSAAVKNQLPISKGGTGASSLPSGAVSSNGTTLSSGTLSIGNGGTGQTSFASGAVSSNGTTLTSGTLSVPNGGTGATSFTSGNLVTGNGTSALGSISQLTSKSFLPSLGQQISSSCGNFSSSSAGEVAVTNLSVSITTTGRPVLIMTYPDSAGSGGRFNSLSPNSQYVALYRGSTMIAKLEENVSGTGFFTMNGSIHVLDPVAAGTYTYTIKLNPTGVSTNYAFWQLSAFEL